MASDARRKVPSVDALLRSEPAKRAAASLGRPTLKHTVNATLRDVRAAAERGVEPPDDDEILARAIERASAVATGLTPVINATGVVLHTNLGRASRSLLHGPGGRPADRPARQAISTG